MIRRISVSPPRLTGDDAELEVTEELIAREPSGDRGRVGGLETLLDDDEEETLVFSHDSAPPPPASEVRARGPLKTDPGEEKLDALLSVYEQRVERLAREADEAAASAPIERAAGDRARGQRATEGRLSELAVRAMTVAQPALHFARALVNDPRWNGARADAARRMATLRTWAVDAHRTLSACLPKDELLARGALLALWGLVCSALTLLLAR